MNKIDKLGLRWQFESFTRDFQDSVWEEMVKEFLDAWRYKANRTYIQNRLISIQTSRQDLPIIQRFQNNLKESIELYGNWSKFDIRKSHKDIYIGPDAYRQM